jgi:hypothetical protein
MGTTNLAVHDFLLGEAINLSKRAQRGSARSKTNIQEEEKGIYGWEGRKKKERDWFNFSTMILAEIPAGDNSHPLLP